MNRYKKSKEKIESLISEEKVHKKTLIQWITASLSISPIYPIIKTSKRVDNKIVETYGHNSAYSDSIPFKTLINLSQNNKNKIFVIFSSKYENNLPEKEKISNDILNLFIDSNDMLFDNNFDLSMKYGNLKYWQKDDITVISPEFHILQGLLDFDIHKISHNIEYGRRMGAKVIRDL